MSYYVGARAGNNKPFSPSASKSGLISPSRTHLRPTNSCSRQLARRTSPANAPLSPFRRFSSTVFASLGAVKRTAPAEEAHGTFLGALFVFRLSFFVLFVVPAVVAVPFRENPPSLSMGSPGERGGSEGEVNGVRHKSIASSEYHCLRRPHRISRDERL